MPASAQAASSMAEPKVYDPSKAEHADSHAPAAQVGKQLECRCGHEPPCQFWQKAWGEIPKEMLTVKEPTAKQPAAPKATKATKAK